MTSINGKYLFSWDEIPGNDDKRLINFLRDGLKIEWAKTENISKIDDGKTIIVSNKEKCISLKLNDEKTKVNLKIVGVRVDEFIVKIENGKLNIYNEDIKKPDEKPWYKNYRFLGAMLAILTLIVAITAYVFPIPPPPPPDFSLSLNPMSGAVQAGGVIQTPIDVKSINGYDFTVSLSANGQPSGIVFTFGPPFGEAKPSYTSTITINVDQSVSSGIYKIGIKGTGANGKEHNCIYTLTVNPTPTPTLTPTLTPTPTVTSTESPTFNVKIISPNENGNASTNTNVEGNVSRALNDKEYLWILISDDYSNWWPQGDSIRPSKHTLEWSGSARIGGEEGDIGRNFRIAVILVNDTLNSRISEWQKECKEKQDWPPITKDCIESHVIQEKTVDEVTVVLIEWTE